MAFERRIHCIFTIFPKALWSNCVLQIVSLGVNPLIEFYLYWESMKF
jgi:hypothetical protein